MTDVPPALAGAVAPMMAEKGLYQKHSLDHPLLKVFAMYLEKALVNEHFKQEVRI
ncbi:MAG: hypothetical protein ACRCTP_04935 [Aeromonas popoffii]|uniref:hypothetical protein n=1 Tax=Aeromonas popoffii TaxID=70856 RepID=UPI003F2F727F